MDYSESLKVAVLIAALLLPALFIIDMGQYLVSLTTAHAEDKVTVFQCFVMLIFFILCVSLYIFVGQYALMEILNTVRR